MSDILKVSTEQCCGCGTCALVCPTGAIGMKPKELGCLYPEVDADKCIECRLCERSCAYQMRGHESAPAPAAFAAMAKNKDMLKKSASGGVFASVAERVLEEGGVVFGCSMEYEDGTLVPRHIGVEDSTQLIKLQGSKYVQSDLGDVFLQIRRSLRQSRTVLFSGTPCQVDALKHYLASEDTARLYTIDIICHGVPSAKLFQGHMETLGKGKISGFRFRDKTLGWGLNARYTLTENAQKKQEIMLPPGLSSYYTYFLSSEIYRESCYSCKYADLDRVGDITIGDYWGFEKEHPELLEENGGPFRVRDGISAVLVNTSKGSELLQRYGDGMILAESSGEKVKKWNRQLRMPSQHSDTRNEIMEQYAQKGYAGVERLFRKQLGIRYGVRKLKALIIEIKNRSLKG